MEEEFNPFQSPSDSSSDGNMPPVKRRASSKTPHAKDFTNLAMQFKFVGGAITLLGLLALCASWWFVTIVVSGVALIGLGYGMSAYKPWAWVVAVAILVPLSVLLVVATVAAMLSVGVRGLGVFMAPAYMWYVLWVLCSRNGRQRYRDTREAILRARANPDSIAGKLISGRVRGRL